MKTINQRFDQIVYSQGDQKAINYESTQYTYSQLQKITDSLILKFKEEGIKRKQLVALYLNDPVLSVLSIVALYRMGCGYIPLDPVYPERRIQYMAGKANITRVVCDTHFGMDNIRQIKLERGDLGHKTRQAITSAKSGEIGYVIYTSGSTGKPKGVEMTCKALDNLINWQLSQPGFDIPVATAQFSALSFDVSFQEIFTTLCSGGCLFLIDSGTKKDFRSLLKFIVDNKIQRIFMPYIALLNLVQWANRLKLWPERLINVITAGEALIIDEGMKRFFEQTGAALYNQYGPTESHVVTQYQMGKDIQSWESSPPIGSAIANTEIYLLDRQGKGMIVEDDLEGEIYITGECLAKGYINNAQETDKKFVDIELDDTKIRAYRTGDMGKWRSDDELIYCGRVDNQVKINGSRIELAEVEAQLLKCPEIEAAAVTIEESNEGDKSLVCFIVTLHEETDATEIRNELKKYLPAYMIPQTILPVVEFDKTPSGKIDRKKMLEDYLRRRKNITPGNTTNNEVFSIDAILSILTEELKAGSITAEHNLIDLGMNSLTANRIVARFYDDLSLDVPAYRMFQYKTVGKLLDALEKSNLKTTVNVLKHEEKSSEQGHDIGIIGMSINVPGAETLDMFWDNLVQGKESLSGDSSTLDGKVSMRGLLNNPSGFDAGFFKITPTEAEFIDPQQRVLLMLAWHALEDAGYVPEEFSGRIGVYCGTGNNTYYLNNVLKNTIKLDEYGELQAMVANEKDYTATRISHKLNLKGPSLSIQTACSTSLVSIHEAVKALRTGDCDLAIAGGSAISFPQYAPYTYQEGSIFSKDGHTRTFDADGSGTVFSDGAGMVILKRLDYAISDNDQIYAVISGTAVNNDGSDKGSFSAPSIDGQQNVIYAAHIDANITADQVDYVEAHGTATPLGDPTEVEALTRAFSLTTDNKQYCGLGSVKSNIGHLTAGAGVIGMIKSALALKNRFIPPTINFNQANPSLNIDKSPFYITATGIDLDKQSTNIIGVSSFGIGGTNAHVVLKSHDQILAAKQSMRSIAPICISARHQNDLNLYLENYQNWFSTHPEISLNQVAYSTHQFRKKFDYRISIAADNAKAAIAEIGQKQRRISNASIFNTRNVAFLFPGQGTQAIQMGKYLYVDCAIYRKYFDACAEILLSDHKININEIIQSDNESLDQTENAQVALFTISYSLAKTMLEINVSPTHMLGHSIGELTCAVIAGVFSLDDALEVVVTRGRIMQNQPTGDMIAVTSNAESLASFISDEVVLAADNSPDVCTLSGPRQAVKITMDKLDEAGIDHKLLNTSHAFHSPLMQGACDDFIKLLSHIQCQRPQLPFISCVTGDWITSEQATNISYWAKQIISTVNFRSGVEQLSKLENLLIIEAGPRKTMAGLCLQNLAEKSDYRIVSLLPEAGSVSNELANFRSALGQIWEANMDIDWAPLYRDSDCYKVDLPLYPFQLRQYFIEPEKAALQAQSSETALASNNSVHEIPPQVLHHNSSPIFVEPKMNNSILDQLKALFADASGLDFSDIDDSANFFELGLDSLFLTQASISIKKEFQVSVTFRQLLNECDSFSKLEKYLHDAGVKSQADVQIQSSNSQPTTVDLQDVVPETRVSSDLNNLLMQQIELIKNQTQALSMFMSQGNALASNPSDPQPSLAQVPAKGIEKNQHNKLKPFGASVRINAKRSNELTPEQVKDLNIIINRYTSRLQKSKTFSQENRKQLADPRVVSGFRGTLKELIFPIVVEKSRGAYLWDIDGNRYIDITCGFGSNFFGNGAEFIKKEVAAQLEAGYEIGPQNPIVAEVSKMFCEMTQSDRVAFCNTGSEAVLGAIRLARTVRAKDKIVMFENDYHGINDEVIVARGRNGLPLPAAAGIPTEHVSNTIILDYGDERSLEYIRENADQIAAVVVEPVQSRNPGLQPRTFLKDLRIICSDREVALIFDEVITGLRIHRNGAQGYFDVKADIATYGKIIGGGMPIGMLAGKREYLDALDGGYWQFGDDSAPEVGVTYFAGTFVRHPLALAAARAVLLHLNENPDIQSEMNHKAEKMVLELNQYCKQAGAPVEVSHCGSLFKILIPQDIAYEELIYVLLREKGIHIWDARPCFITTAHTEEDIRDFVNAFKQSLDEMLAMGFLPSSINTEPESPVDFDANNPPVDGARLGKKPNGEPAWFIEDPNKPKKYRILTNQ